MGNAQSEPTAQNQEVQIDHGESQKSPKIDINSLPKTAPIGTNNLIPEDQKVQEIHPLPPSSINYWV